jgi:hypothetical protein
MNTHTYIKHKPIRLLQPSLRPASFQGVRGRSAPRLIVYQHSLRDILWVLCDEVSARPLQPYLKDLPCEYAWHINIAHRPVRSDKFVRRCWLFCSSSIGNCRVLHPDARRNLGPGKYPTQRIETLKSRDIARYIARKG